MPPAKITRIQLNISQALPDNIPALTKEQHLALDALHFTTEAAALDIDLQPGDLEFFNNLSIFHARTASEDSPENTYVTHSASCA